MFKKYTLYISCLFCLIIRCKSDDNLEKQIAEIPISLKIERFDKEFAEATPKDLIPLKKKYPYLFAKNIPDSIWVKKIQDSLQNELENEVISKFNSFEKEKKVLKKFFQHLAYYFPAYVPPKIVTLTTDIDYSNRVILADSLLFLSLDSYLGKTHPFYENQYQYIRNYFEPERIVIDVADAYTSKILGSPKKNTFLNKMIFYGKQLYLKQLLIPSKKDFELIGYEENKWNWAEVNEAMIWRYFIDNSLLYSTDIKLDRRFLDLAAYSKFYLELDHQSPGMIGKYLGWKMVKSYMKKNTSSLQDLLTLEAEKLFRKSRYKPKK